MEFYKGIFKELKEDENLVTKEVNFYEGEFARLYENLLKNDFYDIDTYISQGAIAGDKILELCCGTGRVGIPLAKVGFSVTGIDISKDMLEIYQEKLKLEKRRVQNCVTLICGDITQITLEEKFDLIILPATTLCLFDKEMIKIIFKFVKENLTQNGRFVFDYVNVNYDNYLSGCGLPMITKWEENNAYNVVFFQEFIYAELKEVVVNIYGEIISGKETNRILGYTRKHIITRELIDECLVDSGLQVIKTMIYSGNDSRNIEFLILSR